MHDLSYAVLLDAPDGPQKRIQIARLGPVKDRRYGEFEITKDNVRNWQTNLEHLPGGRSLIDFEHRSERTPRDSKAAGWVTGIDLDGSKVMADVEWSDEGADAVRNKRYLFLSPAYGPHEDELGNTYDDTLCSVALTNKPKLGSLPMLTLASEERVSEAVAEEFVRLLEMAGDQLADAVELNDEQLTILDALTRKQRKSTPAQNLNGNADSRAAQMERDALLKTLDLDDTADDAKILEALAGLKETAGKAAKLQKQLEKKPLKTLEAQAAEAGLMVLDAARVTELTQQAADGANALKQLHASRFETAFELALNDPKGARVKPAEKERLQHFYALDADGTLAMISEREPIVPAKPHGNPAIELSADADPETVARAGLHPSQHNLDQRVQKYMLDNNIGPAKYAEIVDQYVKGLVTL